MDEKLRFVIELQNKASAELRRMSKDFEGVKPSAGMKTTANWFQQLESVSSSTSKALRPMSGALGTIGVSSLAAGLSITGLISQFRDLAKAAPALQELSRQTGISRTEIERLKFAAKNMNVDPSQMEASLSKFSQMMVEFHQGTGAVYKEMTEHGAGGLAEKIKKESPVEAYKDIVHWLAAIPEAARAAGRSQADAVQTQKHFAEESIGDDMLPMLGKGAAGFDAAMASAQKSVADITDSMIAEATRFNESINAFDQTWKNFETTVGPTVFKNLTKATDEFREVFKEIESAVTWFDQHKEHPLKDVGNAAVGAIDDQAAYNKAHPEGIILDLPGAASDVIHNAIGDRRPTVQPQDNNLGLPGVDTVPDSRPTALRTPAPVPSAFQPAPFHPDDDRLSRARASDVDGWRQQQDLKSGVLQQFGALEKPVLHLSGTLKSAAGVIEDNVHPAAFHPGGAGVGSALDPVAAIAAGTHLGFVAAYRELSGLSGDGAAGGGGGGFTPAAYHPGGGLPGGRSAAAAGGLPEDHPGAPNLRYGAGGHSHSAAGRVPVGLDDLVTPHVALGKMGSKFDQKAPVIMDGLMKKYGLTREQAAGVVGNLGHESAGFTAYHEGGKSSADGGVGWAQWTGARRNGKNGFEAWTKAHGLDPTSDEASWRFLTEGDPETAGAIAAVKRTNNRRDATRAFHDSFERSADINRGVIVKPRSWNGRLAYADRAFAAEPHGASVAQPEPHVPAAKRMAEAADKLKSAVVDQGRAAAIQRRDLMGGRSDRMQSLPQARPEIAPLPAIKPEPPRQPAMEHRVSLDPLHVNMTHTESGRTRVAVRHGEGIRVTLRTGPQLAEMA